MNDQLTILIPTSPIPSHPSTTILDETISNIRRYTDAKIIIMFDGVHDSLKKREQDYQGYVSSAKTNVSDGKYGDCIEVAFAEHSHQSQMVESVLAAFVSTPLIMFCEHDTSPIGEIPFQQLCDFVEKSDKINYLRFNIFDKIPDEHQYLMLDKVPTEIDGVPLVRTIQFSARPHIAKTDWYRDFLSNCFPPGSREMIEDRMHGIVIESHKQLKFDVFGLAVYTPPGNQLRSYHSDGRGTDTKIIQG